MTIASKFLNWLYKRSPQNASDPNPQAAPYNQDAGGIPSDEPQTIEMSIDHEVIIGIPLSFGDEDSIARGPNGELIHSHKKISILCGCGHIASQLHAGKDADRSPQRGISGKCCYCTKEFAKSVKKGLILEIEAERQSLVCTECARRTVSGILCCPRHYAAVGDENGNTVYLGPDEQARQKRSDTIRKILTPFETIFTEPDDPQLPGRGNKNE